MSTDGLPFASCFESISLGQTAGGVFEVTIPAGIVTKQALLECYARQLGCPWFGSNWDALADALNDLSWLNDRPVIIRHADLPFGAGRRSRKIYLEVLADAVSRWQMDRPGYLKVEFPETHLASIRTLAGSVDKAG